MNHIIVADLGYGDAGKGTIVDWLCSPQGGGRAEPVHAVVRFNGGAQAGHNVVTTDGRHHTFAQFGSGSFTPGVRTHLSRFVLVDPLALAAEAAHLACVGVQDALARLTVDRDALLVTPYHQAANRARERARGKDRHGSCGMGIGETASYAIGCPADAPRVSDCAAPRALARKLAVLHDRLTSELGPLEVPAAADLCEAYRAFAASVPLVDSGYLKRLLRAGRTVFEAAQGVLLDEWRGFHPYTTWSSTTFANAETLLAEAGESGTRLGVLRCYMTRHGPGPFVTEDPTLELPEPHNRTGTWQGPFRTGHFDAVALRYAVQVSGGVDAVALTHLDAVARHRLRLCTSYQVDGHRLDRIAPGPQRDLRWQEQLTGMLARAHPEYEPKVASWPGAVTDLLDVPVALLSRGPTVADKEALADLVAHVQGTAATRDRSGTDARAGWSSTGPSRPVTSPSPGSSRCSNRVSRIASCDKAGAARLIAETIDRIMRGTLFGRPRWNVRERTTAEQHVIRLCDSKDCVTNQCVSASVIRLGEAVQQQRRPDVAANRSSATAMSARYCCSIVMVVPSLSLARGDLRQRRDDVAAWQTRRGTGLDALADRSAEIVVAVR